MNAKTRQEKGQRGQTTADYGIVTKAGTLRLERVLPGQSSACGLTSPTPKNVGSGLLPA
jgi:hypothetical protein